MKAVTIATNTIWHSGPSLK